MPIGTGGIKFWLLFSFLVEKQWNNCCYGSRVKESRFRTKIHRYPKDMITGYAAGQYLPDYFLVKKLPGLPLVSGLFKKSLSV
jgi:hypothetical protein